MMDFADDFTCFSIDEILKEARDLYRFNRHITEIRIDTSINNRPELVFYINTARSLTLKQLGLPVKFRCVKTRLQAANQ